MPELARQLEILSLSSTLRGYACGLQSDNNAALLLVHRALTRALADRRPDRPVAGAGADGLEASLRADIRIDHYVGLPTPRSTG